MVSAALCTVFVVYIARPGFRFKAALVSQKAIALKPMPTQIRESKGLGKK